MGTYPKSIGMTTYLQFTQTYSLNPCKAQPTNNPAVKGQLKLSYLSRLHLPYYKLLKNTWRERYRA